jgi:hypothetical protein
MIREQMQLKDKVGYIWDYYKLRIIGAVVIVGLGIYFVNLFTRPKVDISFEAAFVNCYDSVSDSSNMAIGFDEYMVKHDEGSDLGEGKIVYDNNLFFNLGKSSDYNNSYYQKLVAYLEAGTVDVVVCEYDNLIGVGQGGRFLDLRDERIKSVYETYIDRVVYVETEEGNIPIGIDISDSPVIEEMNSYANGCYLAFGSNTKHYDKDLMFLKYLLGE